MERLTKLRDQFKNDRFAMICLGATIDEASDGYVRCSMEIKPDHCNALNLPMGGAIFSLADFAFAVAANQNGKSVVTQAAQITFLTPAQGRVLIAEAEVIREGTQTSFYRVMVTDDLGTEVAFATANGYLVYEEK